MEDSLKGALMGFAILAAICLVSIVINYPYSPRRKNDRNKNHRRIP